MNSNNSSNFNDVPSSFSTETVSSELRLACSGNKVIRNALWESPEKRKQGLGHMKGSVALGLDFRWGDMPLVSCVFMLMIPSHDSGHTEGQLAVFLLTLVHFALSSPFLAGQVSTWRERSTDIIHNPRRG